MGRSLVTGGCGFVGSHLVKRLLDDGEDVTVVDAFPPAKHLGVVGEHARFVQGDITDRDTLLRASKGVDTIYHLAAVVGVDRYLSAPLEVIDTAMVGTRNVLDAATASGARVLVTSTSEVFGKNPKVPWKEDDDRVLGSTSADRWTYSTSKALTEHLVFAYGRQHGTAATIVRYFNVYGPRQRPAFVVSRSIHRALNGLPTVVYDDGGQTRCFTYVDDAVDGTVRAARSDKGIGEAFNVGSMTETTVSEVVALIGSLTGTGPARRVDTATALGRTYQDLARRVPDNTKAREVLGWSCPTTLVEGLSRTIAWARTAPWWLEQVDSGAAA